MKRGVTQMSQIALGLPLKWITGGRQIGVFGSYRLGATLFIAAAILTAHNCIADGAQDKGEKTVIVQRDAYLVNADLSKLEGEGPRGWEVEGDFTYDAGRQVGTLKYGVSVRLMQEVKLLPGHYLLQVVTRTNSNEARLFADALDYDVTDTNFISPGYGLFRIPVGVSKGFKTVKLPFFVEDGGELESVTLGLQAREARAGLEGQDRKPKLIEIKTISLSRLGDTELKRRWAQNLPVDRTHGLTGLREAADFNRPGFAIFTDAYTGAELWLITQGRRSHLQYPGVSYFSDSGKYVFVSNPGIVLRTDGSARFTGYKRKRGGTPWLPAWLQKQVPLETDPDDWVEVETTSEAVTLRNLITRDEMRVEIPTRDGWTLALLPSVKSPMLERQGAPNETLVWVSNDKRTIGLSDVSGRDFREVPVKTHSADPEKDYLNEPFWCKGWDGGWYVGYVLNWLPLHNQILKTPENSINPGQVWVLPISRNDPRGPLYVTGGFEKLQGMRLEDGLVVQRAEALVGGHKAMDGSLRYRMDASKVNTLAVENIETGEVTYIGSYPWMEHIEWSQSWEFGSIRGELAPQPLLFFDLKHRALWPIAVMNFYDYGQRLKDYRDGQRLGTERKGYIFWSGQTCSPDGTKIVYASAMLAYSMRDKGDVYIAVARYPQPPVNVRCEGKRLVWDRPLRHREIRGFNIYRSDWSGVGYQKLHSKTVEGLSYELSRGEEEDFYVLTSVEHSGLESRMFSNEVVVGPGRTVRHFYEAEIAEFEQPLTPVFDPEEAGNGYALAITDPDLLYRDRLRKGLRGVGKLQISIPFSRSYRIFGRVRSLSKSARGCFSIEVNGVAAGELGVEKPVWHWVELKGGLATLSAGNVALRFATSTVDIALDKILVTNDLDFEPREKGNTPMEPPSMPSEIRVEKAVLKPAEKPDQSDPASPYVKLAWNASTAPQGIRYYSIYRSTAVDVTPTQENLIGSSREPSFVDVGITHPKYYYCVVAVDNWGNRSYPSAKMVLTTQDFTDK